MRNFARGDRSLFTQHIFIYWTLFLGVSDTAVNTIHKGSAFKSLQSKGSEELTHPNEDET